MLPSAFYDSVGIPSHVFTRLNSPACAYPYRRFAAALADGRRTARGHRGSLILRCRAFSSPSPDRFIPAPHRQGPQPGLRPVAASRHLTTAGRGWSALGPAPGLQSWPSPDGGRGNNQLRLTYEQPRRHRPDSCLRTNRVTPAPVPPGPRNRARRRNQGARDGMPHVVRYPCSVPACPRGLGQPVASPVAAVALGFGR